MRVAGLEAPSIHTWVLMLGIACLLGSALIAVVAADNSWQVQRGRMDATLFATSRAITQSVEAEIDQAVVLARTFSFSRDLVSGDLLCVAAAFTSRTCPRCGCQDKENRHKAPDGEGGFKLDRFACVRCGYSDDADLNASRIIAMKRLWRESLPAGFREKLASELPAAKSFEQFIRIRAERRGEGPMVERPILLGAQVWTGMRMAKSRPV